MPNASKVKTRGLRLNIENDEILFFFLADNGKYLRIGAVPHSLALELSTCIANT